jgi:hypothetical protein
MKFYNDRLDLVLEHLDFITVKTEDVKDAMVQYFHNCTVDNELTKRILNDTKEDDPDWEFSGIETIEIIYNKYLKWYLNEEI